jgi:hypothetical protein
MSAKIAKKAFPPEALVASPSCWGPCRGCRAYTPRACLSGNGARPESPAVCAIAAVTLAAELEAAQASGRGEIAAMAVRDEPNDLPRLLLQFTDAKVRLK